MGDEAILVHLKTDQMYQLNRTAARVWDLLQDGFDLGSIREALRSEFEVDNVELSKEIDDFCALLTSESLLTADDN